MLTTKPQIGILTKLNISIEFVKRGLTMFLKSPRMISLYAIKTAMNKTVLNAPMTVKRRLNYIGILRRRDIAFSIAENHCAIN